MSHELVSRAHFFIAMRYLGLGSLGVVTTMLDKMVLRLGREHVMRLNQAMGKILRQRVNAKVDRQDLFEGLVQNAAKWVSA